ncbi:MAG TPA: bifunctional (p)ppGpp synthetase/guanosine-3',5'-bis(diphosphate) 3'-pyrophosphohydrolase [Thiobacillaceae bacterium]|nr:bifunctional (p)ppGpp synthetase/guanosine-3',5'-bis(diphosphate) 3'-pyrophosphohydrolase [Thiobacillaceae bacterium]HNU63254.1 bifunctional (p)ppGpp synthetase/guanosine-3',5'-bis(diphosphate) 3'-pyrophosphohydrolase [Thiobacillaceae bacterium]
MAAPSPDIVLASLPPLPEAISYLDKEDLEAFRRAYFFAALAHTGQFRQGGAPYVTHPLAVAEILAGWHLEAQTLIAALLHDVVEDTGISSETIAQEFGKAVANLVDGVTKLEKIRFETKAQAQAENFRKMLLAMARDVRVILIKLADRLHNMRTLNAMRAEKAQRIAQETLEIYAPIANRLGLNRLYQELEDISFKYLHPNRYKVIEKAVKAARGNRVEVVQKIRANILQKLEEAGIEAQVDGREKHLYSIYRKMHAKQLPFSEVYDLYGFRIVVNGIPDCYLTMGVLHGLYKPIPGKFKDYIAIPKPNGYQSLHTTLFGPFDAPMEIQIRTQEMHHVAENGVASHWLYKTGEAPLSEVQRRTHQWLQGLLDLQADSRDSVEFLEHIKVDLFPDEVYVFTPKGTIISLPRGATAVDFAYSVHTDVGNHCVGVKINGDFMPLSTPLRNGDRVEILTSESARPNPAWTHFAYTGKARANIRNALKHVHQSESIALGQRLLEQALKGLGSDCRGLGEGAWERMQKETGRSREEILEEIGLGKMLAFVVAHQLLLRDNDPDTPVKPAGPMLIHGAVGVAIKLGKCCRPIPGDPIIGQIKKEKGLIIHTHDCPQVRHYREDPDKWVDVAWAPGLDKQFDVGIKVVVANQRGVLAKVAATIANEGSDIDNVHMEDEAGAYTNLYFTVSVQNRVHLARLMRDLRGLHEVVRIQRLKGREDRGTAVTA